MQNEDRRCPGRGGIDFIQRWHAALGNLEFAPATHDAHPLSGWCALGLLLFSMRNPSANERHASPNAVPVL